MHTALRLPSPCLGSTPAPVWSPASSGSVRARHLVFGNARDHPRGARRYRGPRPAFRTKPRLSERTSAPAAKGVANIDAMRLRRDRRHRAPKWPPENSGSWLFFFWRKLSDHGDALRARNDGCSNAQICLSVEEAGSGLDFLVCVI